MAQGRQPSEPRAGNYGPQTPYTLSKGLGMSETTSSRNPMLRVLSLRDFRLLFAGAGTSLIGDQFAFIATPWLVLQLTGDPLALGIVLALEGVPRAIFILLGGAITARFSPPLIMI